jgi:hypothetical protein
VIAILLILIAASSPFEPAVRWVAIELPSLAVCVAIVDGGRITIDGVDAEAVACVRPDPGAPS